MTFNKDLSPEVVKALNMSQKDIPPIGLEYLNMSEDEKKSLSMNSADQLFHFLLIKQIGDNIKSEQANSIAAQNVLLYSKLEMATEEVNIFKRNKIAIERVGMFDKRLTDNERLTRSLVVTTRILGIAIGILILLFVFLGPWFKGKNAVTLFMNDKRQTSEWVESVRNLQIYDKGITRDAKIEKRTDAEITANQEQILNSIKPYKK
jgi:hypothetical protein